MHWVQVSFCRFQTCFCFHILFNINKFISMIPRRMISTNCVCTKSKFDWINDELCVKLLVDAVQQRLEFNFILLPSIFIVYKVYTIVIFTLWPKGKHNLWLAQLYCSSRNTMSAATSQFWYQNTISLIPRTLFERKYELWLRLTLWIISSNWVRVNASGAIM